ncbi:MAG: hypothetical protein DDT23_00685 [candidate division WS2 bacterium]|nr:hypothetical protein [Candidatus Lithacetigena glycinireducens]
MSKCYTLKEVKNVRDEISKLGERTFPQLEEEWDKTREEWKKIRVGWNEVMAGWSKARVEWNKAGVRWKGARTEWNKIADWNKTRKEWKEAEARYNKARDELYDAMAEYDTKLFKILISLCPEAYYIEWRGYLAIPKSEDEEWIIPVFTGDFNGVKHKAFSIWTKPKGSCDEKLAREVKDDAEKHR